MCRWQAKRLGDVDYRRAGAVLDDHVGKLPPVMIGRALRSWWPQGTPVVITAPPSRCLLARAAVIRR